MQIRFHHKKISAFPVQPELRTMRAFALAAFLACGASAFPIGGGGEEGSSGILAGTFAGSGEYTVPVVWGDGVHDLHQIWSVGDGEESGYAYGTSLDLNNTDVYNAGVVNPLTVADASAFIYSQSAVQFLEGETVFFRGSNGYYGAWIIDNLYLNPVAGGPSVLLDARWYFAPGGGSDFTVAGTPSVPEPGTSVLLALGLAGMAGYRLRRPASHARGGRTGFGSSGS